MKAQFIFTLLLINLFCSGQEKTILSETRDFIKNAETVRINKDWSLVAEFKSGIGETVQFFPIQIINIKTGTKRNALQVDLQVKTRPGGFGAAAIGILAAGSGVAGDNPMALAAGSSLLSQSMSKDGIVSLYVDKDQVNEMILFLEQNIIPNLNTKYQDKSSEFIFTADEIIFKFLIYEKRKRLSIILNDAESYEFWTESRAEDIGELIPILKTVNSKELDF